jgi:hypothetical protein
MVHPLLEYYVKKVEEMDLGIGIILYVKGLIVEGITVKEKRFYEEFVDYFKDVSPSEGISPAMSDKIDSDLLAFVHQVKEAKREMQSSVPEYIYLIEAKVYSGPSFIRVGFWSGKLSSVDAFSIGREEESIEPSS